MRRPNADLDAPVTVSEIASLPPARETSSPTRRRGPGGRARYSPGAKATVTARRSPGANAELRNHMRRVHRPADAVLVAT